MPCEASALFHTKSLLKFWQTAYSQRNESGQSLQRTFNTTHSKSNYRTVRIIRPHHPLFGKTVNLVKIWEHKKKGYYVIELPDKSHTRIPLYWADEGKTPLTEIPSNQPFFTVHSIRELLSLITTLENKGSKISTIRLSFPHRRPKEDEYGKATGLFSDGGKR